MILSDGTDTREEVKSPGPYCDGMAVVLDHVSLNGDFGDQTFTDGSGGGAYQYGRRVFWWTGTGFLSTTRHATPEEAEGVLADAFPYDDEDDEL